VKKVSEAKRIGPHIRAFIAGLRERQVRDFHMQELTAYVRAQVPGAAPESPSRIFRALRLKGEVVCELISRSRSHYRLSDEAPAAPDAVAPSRFVIRGHMDVYAIYGHPPDLPDTPFVVRRWRLDPKTDRLVRGTTFQAATLAHARSYIPPGRLLTVPGVGDVPSLIEMWR